MPTMFLSIDSEIKENLYLAGSVQPGTKSLLKWILVIQDYVAVFWLSHTISYLMVTVSSGVVIMKVIIAQLVNFLLKP